MLADIAGGNLAPTQNQIKAAAYSKLRKEVLPAWNEELRKLGLPGLSVGK